MCIRDRFQQERYQGYGVKAFTLSMVRAAIDMTDGAVSTDVIAEIVDIGAHMLVDRVHLLDDVPEVLQRVGAEKRLVMITKGDLVHQNRKVTTSGLEHHFSDIEIVLEKDPSTYHRVMRRLDVEPSRFLMVGNSVRSDVLPVLALGGHAVHVPYHLTWELEHVDEHDEEFAELGSIAELGARLFRTLPELGGADEERGVAGTPKLEVELPVGPTGRLAITVGDLDGRWRDALFARIRDDALAPEDKHPERTEHRPT